MSALPRSNTWRRRHFVGLIFATAAAALTGCGKKGDTKPPNKNSPYPKSYPRGARQSNATPDTDMTPPARS